MSKGQQTMQATDCSDVKISAGDASDRLFRSQNVSGRCKWKIVRMSKGQQMMQVTDYSDVKISAGDSSDRLFRCQKVSRRFKWQIIQMSKGQQGTHPAICTTCKVPICIRLCYVIWLECNICLVEVVWPSARPRICMGFVWKEAKR